MGNRCSHGISNEKNQGKDYVVNWTSQKAKIYFDYKTGISPIEIEDTWYVEKLVAMMPEKNDKGMNRK